MKVTFGVGGGTIRTNNMGSRSKLYKDMPGGVGVVIGIVLVAVSLLVLFLMLNGHQTFMKTAVKATATISQIQASGDSHTVIVTYQTAAGPQTARLNQYNSGMRIGQTMEVYYLPDKPQELRSSGMFGAVLPGAILFVMGAVFILFGLQAKKSARLQEELRTRGIAYDADVIDCRMDMSTTRTTNNHSSSYSTTSTQQVNIRYTLIVRYQSRDGNTYECKSRAMSYDPRPYMQGPQVKVYVDEYDAKRYFVDVESAMDQTVVSV